MGNKVNSFFEVDSYISLKEENKFIIDNSISIESLNEKKFYITELDSNFTFKEMLVIHNKIIDFRK